MLYNGRVREFEERRAQQHQTTPDDLSNVGGSPADGIQVTFVDRMLPFFLSPVLVCSDSRCR